MRLEFKNIKIHHFLSYGDIELPLDTNGFILVSGKNNNSKDCSKSNGAGKSTIWSALCFALTGETIQGLKSNLSNIHFNDGCSVELDFICDEVPYKIIRSKDSSNSNTELKIFVNGEDKSGKGLRESENVLNKYLPDLTSLLIGYSIIIGQGLPYRFSNNTPAKRKEVLEVLSKSDFMIEDIKNKVDNRYNKIIDSFNEINSIIISLNSQKEIFESQLKTSKEELTSNCSKDILTQHYKELEQQLNTKQFEYLSWEKNILENLPSEESINNLSSKIEAIKYQKQLEILNFNLDIDKQINKLTADSNVLQVSINNLKSSINQAENIKDTCPTCGQKLPGVFKVDVTNEKTQLHNLEETLKENTSKIATLRGTKESEITLIEQKYTSELATAQTDYEAAVCIRTSYTKQKEQYINEINKLKLELEKSKLELDHFQNNLDRIQKNINELTLNIDKCNTELEQHQKEKLNIEESKNILNTIKTYLKRDFRGYLLQNIIAYIEERAKTYSQYVFNHSEISFERNGNNIDIKYLDKYYENLSGGEKQKIDLIIQFSIRDMIGTFLNFSSNILVLDEIFDNLDDIGCANILKLITCCLNDVTSIYMISHHSDELSIPSDYEITIIKNEDGVSYLA